MFCLLLCPSCLPHQKGLVTKWNVKAQDDICTIHLVYGRGSKGPERWRALKSHTQGQLGIHIWGTLSCHDKIGSYCVCEWRAHLSRRPRLHFFVHIQGLEHKFSRLGSLFPWPTHFLPLSSKLLNNSLDKSEDNITNFTELLFVKLLCNDLNMILQDEFLKQAPLGHQRARTLEVGSSTSSVYRKDWRWNERLKYSKGKPWNWFVSWLRVTGCPAYMGFIPSMSKFYAPPPAAPVKKFMDNT